MYDVSQSTLSHFDRRADRRVTENICCSAANVQLCERAAAAAERAAAAAAAEEKKKQQAAAAAEEQRRQQAEAAKEMKKQQAAAAAAVAAEERKRQEEAAKRALKEAMQAHALTAEDQAQLIAEGVTTVEMFNKIPDDEFGRSGIDIAARREAKRARDQAAEDARYSDAVAAEDVRYAAAVAAEDVRYASALAAEEQRVSAEEERYAQALRPRLRQQVHALITEQLGDGAVAATLKGAVASLAELQGMSADTMQQLGLGIGKRSLYSPLLSVSQSVFLSLEYQLNSGWVL